MLARMRQVALAREAKKSLVPHIRDDIRTRSNVEPAFAHDTRYSGDALGGPGIPFSER